MQKMGIDPNTVEGMERLISISCYEIPDDIGELNDKTCDCAFFCDGLYTKTCPLCKAERLLAEVPKKKVKRWEVYNGDLVRAAGDHRAWCSKNDEDCDCVCTDCFARWLMEELEVEDD